MNLMKKIHTLLAFSLFAVGTAAAAQVSETIQLPQQAPANCIALRSDFDQTVLLSESYLRSMLPPKAKRPQWLSDAYVHRILPVLNLAGTQKDRMGCRRVERPIDSDHLYLIAELIRHGQAAVYSEQKKRFLTTAHYSETQCDQHHPAGWLSIVAEDGPIILGLPTCIT